MDKRWCWIFNCWIFFHSFTTNFYSSLWLSFYYFVHSIVIFEMPMTFCMFHHNFSFHCLIFHLGVEEHFFFLFVVFTLFNFTTIGQTVNHWFLIFYLFFFFFQFTFSLTFLFNNDFCMDFWTINRILCYFVLISLWFLFSYKFIII